MKLIEFLWGHLVINFHLFSVLFFTLLLFLQFKVVKYRRITLMTALVVFALLYSAVLYYDDIPSLKQNVERVQNNG